MINSILQYLNKSDKTKEMRCIRQVKHLEIVFSQADSIFLNNYMRKLCVV